MLLKFLTTGVEVSAHAPFAIRATSGGLLQRLPAELQHAVRGVPLRKSASFVGTAHRFWITADDIPFDRAEGKGDSFLYHFGQVPMRVKEDTIKQVDADGN